MIEALKFERITFSVYSGMGMGKYLKDVEITKDSIVYYRSSEQTTAKFQNYRLKLDASGMQVVYELLESSDFNSLKQETGNAFDIGLYSLYFEFANGEAKMQGTLTDELKRKVNILLTLLEKQNLQKSENRHFTTTKDVLPPPPPGVPDSKWYPDFL